jgi:hypothetical protein
MIMRSILRYFPLFAILVVTGAAFAEDPKTALGRWMQKNMGDPMAADSPDFGKLATSFNTVAKSAPDAKTYPQWVSFANQGAAAAAKGDKAGVKAACNGCHKAPATNGAKNLKEQYKADPSAAKTYP